ncbi:MAG: TldD/PmbA family protein [Candidatus Latescibacterota bacterium]
MEQVMKSALRGIDADYADIRVERSDTTSLAYMGPVLEDIGTFMTLGGCIRVCIKGGWGFASFSRIEDAEKSVHEAFVLAKLAGESKTVLAPVEPLTVRVKNSAGKDPADVPLDEKLLLLKKYNDMMVGTNGIVTTNSVYRDIKKTVWLHTSEGSMIEQDKIYAGVSLMAVARDGSNVQRGMKSFGDQRGYETVENREDEVEKILKITRDLIHAPKVSGGVYPVILDPQLSGVFVHEALGHLSEADFVYENPQALEMMKLGRRFGPDMLNIIDDGSIDGENGRTPFDDEGVKGKKTYLVKDGILKGRLHSRETAGIMGESPTGNARAISASFRPLVRMTTTFIDRGESSFEEMLEGISDGIYACGFLGGNTDLERFTFSSAYAYRIENGCITTPLRDVILSGNVFDTLNHIVNIGNDLTLFGGLGGCGKGGQSPLPVTDGSPHVRIEKVLVG